VARALLPETTAACERVNPHSPQHHHRACFVVKEAASHPNPLIIIDRDEHNTVLSELALRNPRLPEPGAKVDLARQRGRERVWSIRQRAQPNISKPTTIASTHAPNLH
jgi:hypothetical protein